MKKSIQLVLIFIELLSLTYTQINISNYSYPKIETSSSDDDYVIPIFATNDIHSFVFPLRLTHPADNGSRYLSGGAEYLYSYIKILREEWGDRLMYFDAGDQYDGGVEGILSDGEVMNAYFNYSKLSGISLGNHEIGKGLETLRKYMPKSNFPYIDANIINKTTGNIIDLPNLVSSKVYTVGKVKIGVIGLITLSTPETSGKTYEDVTYEEYIPHIITESNKLNQQNVNAIILLAHVGTTCERESTVKLINNMRDINSEKLKCSESGEINKLLRELGVHRDLIDIVIAGHSHDVIHQWIYDVPVIETSGSSYGHVIYMHFSKKEGKFKLRKKDTQIEGPLPACEKIFKDDHRCTYRTITNDTKKWEMSAFTFHNKIIELDSGLSSILKTWKNEIDKMYKKRVFHTDEDLSRCPGNGECALVNLISDLHRVVTGADISILNPGGFRTDWHPGYISEAELFMMFPFSQNNVATFEMTGREVKRMIQEVDFGKQVYPTSGLEQVFVKDKNDYNVLVSLSLYDDLKDKKIDDNKTYVIASNDFMAKGGDDFKKVRKWYTPRNYKEYGTTRAVMLEVLKNIKNIPKGVLVYKDHPRIRFIDFDQVRFVHKDGNIELEWINQFE